MNEQHPRFQCRNAVPPPYVPRTCFILPFLFLKDRGKKTETWTRFWSMAGLKTSLENSGKCFSTHRISIVLFPAPWKYMAALIFNFHGCTHTLRKFWEVWCVGVVYLLVEKYEEDGTYYCTLCLCGCLLFSQLQTILDRHWLLCEPACKRGKGM